MAAAFSRAAASYDEHARMQRIVLATTAELLANHLPAPSTVLDIGCGTGALARLPQSKLWRLVGIDMARQMCRHASLQMPVANACAEALPFARAAFDGALCSLVLQWVNEPRQMLREMARTVRPGGVCGLAVLGPDTLCELKRAFAAIDTHAHVNEFLAPQTLDTMLAAEGFAVLTARTEAIAMEYADVRDLLREIKRIGASHVRRRRPGLATPTLFTRLDAAYPTTGNGIVATWDIRFRIVERRGSSTIE